MACSAAIVTVKMTVGWCQPRSSARPCARASRWSTHSLTALLRPVSIWLDRHNYTDTVNEIDHEATVMCWLIPWLYFALTDLACSLADWSTVHACCIRIGWSTPTAGDASCLFQGPGVKSCKPAVASRSERWRQNLFQIQILKCDAAPGTGTRSCRIAVYCILDIIR